MHLDYSSLGLSVANSFSGLSRPRKLSSGVCIGARRGPAWTGPGLDGFRAARRPLPRLIPFDVEQAAGSEEGPAAW